MSAKNQNSDYLQDRRLDNQIRSFARIFGVGSDYMEGGSILPLQTPDERRLNQILADQGAIINPACTVGFYWDWDHYDPPSAHLKDDLSEPATEGHPHGHYGTPSVTFKNAAGTSSTVTRDYVDDAANFYEVDLFQTLSRIRMHPENDNYPIKIDDPEGETFVMIAPRRMAGDR